MKKHILLGVLLSVSSLAAYSQYTNDAIRFSRSQSGSTARFKALGNATTATGGDISSIGSNPAGLGLFTRTEFSITPEFGNFNEKSVYLNSQNKTSLSRVNLNQAGVVFNTTMIRNSGTNLDKGLLSLNYGFGYQRTNDFYFDSNFGGMNNSTSMADYFAQLGGNTLPSNLPSRSLERYAYDNFLISYDDTGKYYYPETYADATTGNMQNRKENKIGGQSEATFAIGGNISNQFYFGASLGLLNLKYESDAQYSESGKAREYVDDNPTGNIKDYNFLFNQRQKTTGSGINAKFGFIYKASDDLRIGINLQTPSWYTVEDTYTEVLDNSKTSGGYTNQTTYDFRYNLATPFKASLGVNYILNGKALFTADLDFVDFAGIRFSTINGQGDFVINNNNFDVKQNFKQAINYRVGLEYKLNTLNFRAGYGLEGSPYKTDTDDFYKAETYTAGIGIRGRGYYLDLAYLRNEANVDVSPYTLSNGAHPAAAIKNTRNNVFLTLGLRF